MNEATKDNPGVIAPPPLIALATLLLGLALDWLLPAYIFQIVFTFWDRVVIGVVLMAPGGALAVAAIGTFRSLATNVEPWKPSVNLATIGIYRWLRNPMYVGVLMILAGLGFLLASDWTLALLVPAALILHFGVVLREERYLEKKFGEAYRRYKASVPRYGWPF